MVETVQAGGTGRRPALFTAATLVIAAVLMFGFGYAMVPLYYKFCELVGITTARDFVRPVEWSAATAGRQLRGEFDANSHSSEMAMIPAQQVAQMRTGVAYSITYELRNLTDAPLRGQAVPSYSPARAGKWVTKLQCFCFEEVELAPGEVRRVPVVLTFAPELPEDIAVVALSYTFFARNDQGPEGEKMVPTAEGGGGDNGGDRHTH
ncbi:MAG: cytochrome c oxidase assembly protein [Betaproteobacteria bacterium]|nr:cytochrome c oxidase assembly protein [Betaproteobacteria bacterium]